MTMLVSTICFALLLFILLGGLKALVRRIFVYFQPESTDQDKPMRESGLGYYRTAIHEAGHFITAWSCSHVNQIKKAYINSAGGRVEFEMTVDGSVNNSWCYLVILLAGVSAENFIYGKMMSAGSKEDLLKARDVVENILKTNPNFDPPEIPGSSIDFSAIYTDKPTEQETKILAMAYRQSKIIIKAHSKLFMHIATTLYSNKSITESDAQNILGDRSYIKFVGVFRPAFIYPGHNMMREIFEGATQ